jgi:lysophospholipase L1-like esterase
MKRIEKLSLLISLIFLLSSSVLIWSENKTIALDSEHVRKIGRTYEHSNGLVLAFSSSGIEFNVKAKYLEVTIAGDSGARGRENDSSARIVAFVNGERLLDKMISKKTETFTIFDQKKNVEGLVQILKVSESANSLAAITSLSVNEKGKVSPSKERDFKIEFIGDSITCGYGVDDPVKEHHFKTSTEDSTKTYAFKTAQALNADWSFVSVSGWGITSGYTSNGHKNADSVIPRIYEKIGFSWGNTIFGLNPVNVNWNFAAYQPDFVVINLGTNDASYTNKKADRVQEYTDSYVEFLKKVRQKNPKAYIISCLGMMGDDLYTALSQAVSKYSSETGDSRISALRLNPQQMSDTICADWHPSEKTHEKASKQLVDAICKERTK